MSESFEKAVEAAHDAATAWLSDMRGDLPGDEMVCALTAALPHLTAEDVPHLIRQAKAEAWEEGLWAGATYHPSRRDFEDMRLDVEPVPPANPYAEETTDDHA